MSPCKLSGVLYYANLCSVTPIHDNNITVMVSISIIYYITNRLADSQLFMYFQILRRTQHFSMKQRFLNPIHHGAWNVTYCRRNIHNDRLLDKRTFIFCHQSNYSGSVVQDRQALRKMYGLSDFVFTAITIYSPLLLQENIESVQNFQSTLFDRLLHNLKLHKHSYSGKGLFDHPLILSSVT